VEVTVGCSEIDGAIEGLGLLFPSTLNKLDGFSSKTFRL